MELSCIIGARLTTAAFLTHGYVLLGRRSWTPFGPWQMSVTGVYKMATTIHGAHLERPFVSPHKLGAQPSFNIEPTADRVAEAIATGCVRVVTITPELEHSTTAMQTFARAGIRVSLIHTTTDHAGAERAICLVCAAGGRTVGATHLFNAMSPIEGLRPGPVTALMCDDLQYASCS